jgi:hypothetical protein
MKPMTRKIRPPTDPGDRLEEALRKKVSPDGSPPHSHREEGILAVSGAVTGAATGAVAGPPGMVAGAVIGAAVGAVIGLGLDREDERKASHDQELDREIGVTEGDLGAARPDQPPAVVGAYSSGSAGAGGSGTSTSEGPMQNPETD